MAVLGLVTSHTDCGVPGNWFSHATGLAHDEDVDTAVAEAAAAGVQTVRAHNMTTAPMAAAMFRHRLGSRILNRAIGALDLARAATLITAPQTRAASHQRSHAIMCNHQNSHVGALDGCLLEAKHHHIRLYRK
jgi:hypothetical protein